jgi:hypothetical protein
VPGTPAERPLLGQLGDLQVGEQGGTLIDVLVDVARRTSALRR